MPTAAPIPHALVVLLVGLGLVFLGYAVWWVLR